MARVLPASGRVYPLPTPRGDTPGAAGNPSAGATAKAIAETPVSGTVVVTGVMPPHARVTLLTAPDAVSVTGGVGGWDDIERRGMEPVKTWRGGTTAQITLQGILHHQRRGMDAGDVGERITRLVSLGRRRGGDPHPTPVILTGDIRHPLVDEGGQWVIQGISFGQPLRRDGVILHQAVQIDLDNYRAPSEIQPVPVGRTRAGGKPGVARKVTARRGDTLRVIAARELGNPARWVQVRDWNRVVRGRHPVGPDEPLRPGVRLVIK